MNEFKNAIKKSIKLNIIEDVVKTQAFPMSRLHISDDQIGITNLDGIKHDWKQITLTETSND